MVSRGTLSVLDISLPRFARRFREGDAVVAFSQLTDNVIRLS
jgi:hypothetical protein